MNPSARDWLDGLQQFADEFRLQKPLAKAAVRAAEATAQRAILAVHMATWIESGAIRIPATHAIAWTTSDLGIDVADELVARHESLAASIRPRLVAVREIEYRMWTKDHPDAGHLLHVNHWSWIKAPVPRQRWHEFRRHPLRDGESYWLHRTGSAGPGSEESRHAHLWKWTGSQAVLLEPFITERVDAL